MGGFNPPVPQQDSNWEIRVAVLLSLLFQVLLVFAGPMRKRSSSPVARFAIWSCYLLADWVADLALGLLLNNMSNIGGGRSGGSSSPSTASVGGHTSTDSSGNPVIFAFWTPFLLLHLGGQDTITGYSIEDNELWLRHLIGLLFELFSAAFIFFSSLQSNPMIPATVLMFVVGIIKYGERTYSLYSSSVDGVLGNILGDPIPGFNYAKFMTVFSGKEKAGLAAEIVIANGEAKKTQDALERDKAVRSVETNKTAEARAYEFFHIFRSVCYDVTVSSKEREISRVFFLERADLKAKEAFEVMEMELNFLYDMVHTKAPFAHTKARLVLRFVGSGCLASALAIFSLRDKGSIQRADVAITYALLVGGLALDAAALVMLFFSNWTMVFLEESNVRVLFGKCLGQQRLAWLVQAVRRRLPRTRRWSERTSQLNLISYCLDKPDSGDDEGGGRRRCRTCCFACPRVLGQFAKVAEKLHLSREVFDDFIFIRRQPVSVRGKDEPPLLKFLFEWMREAATRIKSSYEEMKRMHNSRGEGVLEDLRKDRNKNKIKSPEEFKDVLVGSVRRDFDQSLLMWHIATDLCSRPKSKAEGSSATASHMMSISKTLSKYMLYLLVKQPKILAASAGVGKISYRDTCEEARRFFREKAVWDPNNEEARRMLLSVNTSKAPREVKGDESKSVLFDACRVAKVLMELDEDTMWETVGRVWVEMLTYAARMCKGSTHMQQLSRGGELITIVWFLMEHMGLGAMYEVQEGDGKVKLIIHA